MTKLLKDLSVLSRTTDTPSVIRPCPQAVYTNWLAIFTPPTPFIRIWPCKSLMTTKSVARLQNMVDLFSIGGAPVFYLDQWVSVTLTSRSAQSAAELLTGDGVHFCHSLYKLLPTSKRSPRRIFSSLMNRWFREASSSSSSSTRLQQDL